MFCKYQAKILIYGCLFLVAGCVRQPVRPAPLFFPPPPAQPRIQFLATYSCEDDVKGGPGTLERLAFGKDRETVEFVKPYGVACHNGKIYVCDTRSQAIHVLDPVHRTYHPFGRKNTLLKPINIVFDEKSYAYVADTVLNQVVVFDELERYVRSMGDSSKIRPCDLAIHGNRLYVCDVKNHVIRVWNKDTGEEVMVIGRPGSKEGEFFHPTNICLDGEGNLFVSDTGNFRVQKLDSEGRFLKSFGGIGMALGKLARPKGIALDEDENLYIVDAGFENVQIFDKAGRLLMFFGEPGNGPGQMNLPAKVIVTRELLDYYQGLADPDFSIRYLVLVSSQYGLNKVNVYGFGEYRSGE